MKHRRKLPKLASVPSIFLLLGLGVGPVGCVAAPDYDVEFAVESIIGGTAATSSTMRPEIGRWGGCTASLIAAQWVLTAGHCNDYQDLTNLIAGAPIYFESSSNGTTWPLNTGGCPGSACVATHRAMFLGDDTVDAPSDVRLIRLTAPVSSSVATPTTLLNYVPSTGTVTIWGQGGTGVSCGSPTPGTMRYLELSAPGDPSVACPGDSGGPTVINGFDDGGGIFYVSSTSSDFGDAYAFQAEVSGIIAEWGLWSSADIADNGWCTHATGHVVWGDVDNDGDADAICHDTSSGYRWVAENYRRLIRERFSTATPFCAGSGRTLLTGDFGTSSTNAAPDGRTDLLCHVTAGTLQIDFATSSISTRYGATDWTLSTGWCTHSTGRIHTGDFNGDGRTDLLCHDTSSGQMWIDFASSTAGAPFAGASDWNPGNSGSNWCGGSSSRLYAGDIDGDAATDLVCHTTTTGALAVQFSDSTATPFVGGVTDDSMTGGWSAGTSCSGTCPLAGQACEAGVCVERLCVSSGTMTIADISGDGLSDIVCSYSSGRTYAVRAYGGSPTFPGHTALQNSSLWYSVALARFRARTADAASRPWTRW